MEDDDVVFQNSALHDHLKSVGFTDDVVKPEDLAREYPTEDAEGNGSSCHKNSHSCKSLTTFWEHLKNSVSKAFWDEAWNDQLTEVHNKHADELTDGILQSPVLEEEDGVYIESFYTSIQSYRPDGGQGESSIMGVMLMQMAILSVSLAYAGFRMVYLKSPDITSRYYIWSIDVIAVLLTIAALTPTTVKSASAGRAINRLKEFTKIGNDFLGEVKILYGFTKKSIRLIQEMELVVRGFTIISPRTPVTRLEQGNLQPSLRQCPKLRRMTFHVARSLMLNIKRASQNLLRSFPSHVEIDGLSSYLANQPLHHYGPCVYTCGDDMETKLRAVTEDYSLASLKAIVELCNLHVSEFLRVLAMSCLTQAEEHDKNPSYNTQKKILKALITKFRDQTTPLKKLYTSHKTLNTTRERREKERVAKKPLQQSPSEALYVAVHSLSLHLQAALNRVQGLEEQLEPFAEMQSQSQSQSHPTVSLLTRLNFDLGTIKVDLDACHDCCEEGQIRVMKISGKNPAASTDEVPNTDATNANDNPKPKAPPVPLFDMAEPEVVDQVFQAYTDTAEDETFQSSADDLLSEEEKAKKKQERREAVRLLKELRSVIAVRALEHEERERQALLRQYPDEKFEDPIASLRRRSNSFKELDASDVTMDMETEDTVAWSESLEPVVESNNESFEDSSQANGNTKSAASDIYGHAANACPNSGAGDTRTADVTSLQLFPHSDIKLDGLKEKLAGMGGANFAFSTDVAAQAAARSHQLAAYSEDTFGDEDSDEDVAECDRDMLFGGPVRDAPEEITPGQQ